MYLCMLVVLCLVVYTGCSPFTLGQKSAEMLIGENESTEDYNWDDYNDDYETDTAWDYDDTDLDDTDYDDTESDDFDYDTEDIESDKISASIITDYNWKGANDGSLIICEVGETFRYFQSADNLEDNYYEGTYEFYVGQDAVDYVTTTLSEYAVTEEELEGLFERSDEYDVSDFVCFVLHNEACIVDGENTVDEPYTTPYFGFCFEEDGTFYLDIANMNTANYHTYIAE